MKNTSWLRDALVVLGLNLRNALARPMLPVIVVIGFIAVVLVLVSVLSIGRGLSSTFANTGSADVAVALASGAYSESVSNISESDARAIASQPGIKQSAKGPVVSPELVVTASVPKRGSSIESNVVMRGVTSKAFTVHSKVHMIAGRRFKPGLHEIIVGRQAAREYQGLELGDELHTGSDTWKVVGIFAANANLHESEIWTDVQGLQTAFHIGNRYSSVYAQLMSPAAYKTFSAAAKKDPRLDIHIRREKAYYANSAKQSSKGITTIGIALGVLMALGAIIGAINLMYTNLASRIGEIATLRAVGFRRLSVLCAVLLEGLSFGLIGGIVGGAIAYALFNGYQAGTIAGGMTQIAFQFQVTLGLLVTGVIFALIMGFIGGLFPAIRAARLPLAKALREV